MSAAGAAASLPPVPAYRAMAGGGYADRAESRANVETI